MHALMVTVVERPLVVQAFALKQSPAEAVARQLMRFGLQAQNPANAADRADAPPGEPTP